MRCGVRGPEMEERGIVSLGMRGRVRPSAKMKRNGSAIFMQMDEDVTAFTTIAIDVWRGFV